MRSYGSDIVREIFILDHRYSVRLGISDGHLAAGSVQQLNIFGRFASVCWPWSLEELKCGSDLDIIHLHVVINSISAPTHGQIDGYMMQFLYLLTLVIG